MVHNEFWGRMLDRTYNEAIDEILSVGDDQSWALSLVEASRDLICLCHGGFVTFINEAGLKHLGIKSAKDIIGRRFTDFVHTDDRDTVQWLLEKRYQEQDPLTIKLVGIGNKPFDADTLFVPFDNDGETGMVVQAHDISLRKERDERIQFQANYDMLTGLPNRSLFLDRLNQGMIRSQRENKILALMFIDLDGFKYVNDILGHHVGDLLLQQAAKRLTDCMRSTDTVARLGGDEFTIIMPSLDDPARISLAAQRILDALEKPFHLNDEEALVTGSIGITVYPDDSIEANDLLRNADAAMYRAKDQGKATFHYYTAGLNEEVKERVAIKNGLSKAMERNEFSLHYQPKLDLQTDCFTGVEALMRWNSEELGFVTPNRFIPSLEETGLVNEVGEWVIRQACKQHLKWLDAGLPPVRVAVNLSARQLREPSFVSIVDDVLRELGVAPQFLEIEITESMLMSDSSAIIVALDQLHEMGIPIAMDDFGTGYSSLSYLKRFPIDTIKIDRSFVAEITSDPDYAEIIKTIISMGKTLNRKIIAEGVETEEQLSKLREYHCDEIQGYFISRPMPAAGLMSTLKERKFSNT